MELTLLLIICTLYLACEGGRASAMEWIPPSLGFLCIFVSAVNAIPVE